MAQRISLKNDAPPASPAAPPTSAQPFSEEAALLNANRASPPLPPLAPVLMMVFWMLLGGAAGIKIMESIWHLLGIQVGSVAIVVPVGGGVGALAGALLGLISNPRTLVLLMAVFAGSAAGAVAGKLPWGDIGELGGQVAGGLVGGMAWATWLFIGRRVGREKKE
jgi:hypothetical protein